MYRTSGMFFHSNPEDDVYMKQPPGLLIKGSLVVLYDGCVNSYMVLNNYLERGLASLAQLFKSWV